MSESPHRDGQVGGVLPVLPPPDPPSVSLLPGFRDGHLRALLGFGLLVAFLGRYGPGSMATSILTMALGVQWAILIQGFLYFFLNGKIHVGAQR